VEQDSAGAGTRRHGAGREYSGKQRRASGGRHHDGERYPPSRSQLDHIVQSEWAGTLFLNAWLGDRLVATPVTDTHDHGLSAIYTFFDPDLADRSLGVFAIRKQVEECRRRGLPHLYLGFWIAESPKMRYKIDYQPPAVARRRQLAGSWTGCSE